jgi:NitT/TauT family transport system substrate-binding protein
MAGKFSKEPFAAYRKIRDMSNRYDSSRDASRRAFLASSAAAALAGAALPAWGADLVPIRLGASPTDATAGGYYGIDQGFYKEAGLDATMQANRNTGALAAAVTGGSLDAIAGSIVPIAAAFLGSLDLRAVAPGQVYDGGPPQAPMAVGLNSKITNGAGLAGKTIAVNGLRDLTHLFALAWVDANGGDANSVKIVEIPFPSMLPALLNGTVDAAQLVEPFASAAKGKVTLLGDSMPAIAPRFLVTGWFSSLAWLNQNKDLARKFRAATLKADAWANANHDASAAILGKYTPIPPDVIRTLVRAKYDTVAPTAALIQPVLTAMTKYFQTAHINAADLLWNG